MKTKRLLALLLALVMMTAVFAGCGTDSTAPADDGNTADDTAAPADGDAAEDGSLQYVLDNGALILGLDDSFPPMGYRDDNDEIIGFDIDVAAAVCEKLGVALEVQPIDWEAKEQELNTKNIDCIWNGMSVTEERKEQLSLSIPYMENHMALVVRPDSGIETIADMEGKILALQSGSSAEDALNANEELSAAIADTNFFQDNLNALMDLETQNSDAVLMDDVVAKYLIAEGGKDLLVLNDFLYAEDYAIGFRKEDVALTEAVNDALRALKEDGTLGEIATKWFGSDTTIVA